MLVGDGGPLLWVDTDCCCCCHGTVPGGDKDWGITCLTNVFDKVSNLSSKYVYKKYNKKYVYSKDSKVSSSEVSVKSYHTINSRYGQRETCYYWKRNWKVTNGNNKKTTTIEIWWDRKRRRETYKNTFGMISYYIFVCIYV